MESPADRPVSPRDRGAADSYYRRPPKPHKWMDGLGRFRVDDLSPDEIKEYNEGYDQNERDGAHKEW